MHHTSSDNKVQRKPHQSNDLTNGRTTGMLALDPIILQFASNHATSARIGVGPSRISPTFVCDFFYLSRKLDCYANTRYIINAVAYNITVMNSVGDGGRSKIPQHVQRRAYHPKTDSLRNQITCIIRSIFRAPSNIRFALALYDYCQTICVCYCASFFLCVCVTRCMTALKA